MASAKNKPHVCFLQPDFIEKVKQAENPLLDVAVLDDATVFHVRYVSVDNAEKAKDAQSCKEPHDCHSAKQASAQVFLKIVGDEASEDEKELVSSTFGKDVASKPALLVLIGEKLNDDSLKVFLRSEKHPDTVQCEVLVQPSKELLYSRSKGILESSLLEKRKVAIVGLGSGGSFIAVELAKAGVGHFVLIDYDRIELNNIARHVCGLNDLGRLKTNAVRDILLNKNPFITIETHCCSINELPKARKILKDCDLIIAATDNIRSRLNINSVSIEYKVPAIYGKCAIRAAGGDVLRVRPLDGPCFSCVFTNQVIEKSAEEMSTFRQAREAQPNYVPDSDVEATIQVGLSSDIIPIGTMIVKLALVELCRGQDSALVTLEKDFVQPYYRWANRREQDYSGYPEDGFLKFNQPSILRWYPVELERKDDCTACKPLPEISEEDAAFFGDS